MNPVQFLIKNSYSQITIRYLNQIYFFILNQIKRTITYSIENKLFVYSILYLNDRNYNSNYSHHRSSFKMLKNEIILKNYAICKKYNSFDFFITSSLIEGYSTIQTYYVKTNNNDILKCIIFELTCFCFPLESNKDINLFLFRNYCYSFFLMIQKNSFYLNLTLRL
jgi:hypothetical protein